MTSEINASGLNKMLNILFYSTFLDSDVYIFVIVMGMEGRLAVSEVVYFAGYFYKDFIYNDFD